MSVFAMTVFSPTWLAIAALVLAIGIIAISHRRVVRKCRVLDIALNNMSQGLVLFDRTERMVICNDRYIDLYGLSRNVVKPGATLRDIIRNRSETGSFAIDIEKYRADILASVAAGDTLSRIVETPDGRAISVINRPIVGGDYWVGTHEDITERHNAEKRCQPQLPAARNMPACDPRDDQHEESRREVAEADQCGRRERFERHADARVRRAPEDADANQGGISAK